MAEYTDTYGQTTLRQSGQSLSSANLQSCVSQYSHFYSTGSEVKEVWGEITGVLLELALFGKYRVEPVVVCGSSVLKQNWAAPAVVRKPPQAEQLWVTNSKTLLLDSQFGSDRLDLVWDNLRARPIHIQKFNFLVYLVHTNKDSWLPLAVVNICGHGQVRRVGE